MEGRLDYTAEYPDPAMLHPILGGFCLRVRAELDRILRQQFPHGPIVNGNQGDRFVLNKGKFAVTDALRTKDLTTGEQRLSIGGFTASGVVDSSDRHTPVQEAVRQNWYDLENKIVAAAQEWFQTTITARDKRAAAGGPSSFAASSRSDWNTGTAGSGWQDRPRRGVLSAQMRRQLARLDAVTYGPQAGEPAPETATAGPAVTPQELGFASYAELAAWASQQAVAERQR